MRGKGETMTPEERTRVVIDEKLEQSGWIIQDMKKRFIFTMQITHKMLNALRQCKHGLQINELLINSLFGWILFCQQLQDFTLHQELPLPYSS